MLKLLTLTVIDTAICYIIKVIYEEQLMRIFLAHSGGGEAYPLSSAIN